MTTIISPNIKKTSERIDTAGNVINPKTKEIIQKNEPEFIPPIIQTKEEDIKIVKQDSMSDKINKMVEAKIAEKIDAIVAQRVNEALKNL